MFKLVQNRAAKFIDGIMTGELICIYRAAKIATGNQSKAHLDASFERIGRESSGHYYNRASIVQYTGITNSEQLTHHRKSSTDQEHICYFLCPNMRDLLALH
jgi:hypothetical protein